MCGAEVQRTTQETTTTTNNYQWGRRIQSGRSTKAQETRMGNTILGALERIWEWTRSMESRNGVATCKTGGWRLLDEAFETNPIKRGGKIPLRQLKKLLEILAISENVFQQQQQLRYSTYFSQSLHFQENQQYKSSTRDNWERRSHISPTVPSGVNNYIIILDKLHIRRNRQPQEIHEVCENTITNQNLPTTALLSIS